MTDEAPNNAHMAMHLQPSSTTLAAAGAMPDQDFLLVLDMLHALSPGSFVMQATKTAFYGAPQEAAASCKLDRRHYIQARQQSLSEYPSPL